MRRLEWLSVVALFLIPACQAGAPEPSESSARPAFALAIHGGAGVIERTMDDEVKEEYLEALRRALRVGTEILESGGTSLDAVEQVIRSLEDEPRFNAGKGAVFTHDGGHELDALIMDGSTLECGAVTGLTTVRNPISLARMVMERSKHVFFAGPGAEEFASEMGVERVDAEYFFVQRRYDQWQKKLARDAEGDDGADVGEKGTVGAVALDRYGNLAAATSTGGMTDKRFGRVGDVPIVGAGTYANNKTCAVSGTGRGEEFIRHTVTRDIAALMEYKGLTLQKAAEEVIHGKLQPGDGGIIAVDRDGAIALVFNSEGMFRGAADSEGRFEVAIWE